MANNFLKITLWFFGILLVINLIGLDFIWISSQKKQATETSQIPAVTPIPTTASQSAQVNLDCSNCKSLIKDEIAKAIPSIPPKVITQTVVSKPAESSSNKITYISIGSSGSVNNMSWADLPGTDFYFDLSDYSGAKSVRWEASLQSYNSTDPVYARLYDVTNNRGVDGSDLSTTSSSYTYIRSSDLTIWRGNNLYRIQARGSSGNTVNLSSPRLKVIF